MLRILVVLLALASSASAQVMQSDRSLVDQLVPESFKIEGSAVASKVDYFRWETTVNYSITNNTGMNLYLGVAMRSVAIGVCSEAYAARGGLQLLPVPGVGAYSIDVAAGPPRATFVPAGSRVAGAIIVDRCEAPNPGSPTAQLSMSLLLGRSQTIREMVSFPVAAEIPVRRIER